MPCDNTIIRQYRAILASTNAAPSSIMYLQQQQRRIRRNGSVFDHRFYVSTAVCVFLHNVLLLILCRQFGRESVIIIVIVII